MTGRCRRRRGAGGLVAAAVVAAFALAGAGDPAAGAPVAAAQGQLVPIEVYRLAVAAGLPADAAVTATAVALAESGGDVDVAGDEGLVDDEWGPSIGVWQIRCLHAATGTGAPRDCSRLTDPAFNAAAMAAVSATGTSWAPWSAYTSGAYREHLGAAEAAAAEAGR